jgi:hypothetical protein
VKARVWIAGVVLAVLLAVAGIFFARLDLGKADQYASVASFFLALVTGAVTLLAWLRAKVAKPADPDAGTGARFAFGNENVQVGDRSVMHITRHAGPASRKRRRT